MSVVPETGHPCVPAPCALLSVTISARLGASESSGLLASHFVHPSCSHTHEPAGCQEG